MLTLIAIVQAPCPGSVTGEHASSAPGNPVAPLPPGNPVAPLPPGNPVAPLPPGNPVAPLPAGSTVMSAVRMGELELGGMRLCEEFPHAAKSAANATNKNERIGKQRLRCPRLSGFYPAAAGR